MPKNDPIRTRHEELKKIISHHDHLYYVLDKPELTDYQYDQLFSELLTLEKTHSDLDLSDSPSVRVGGAALDAFSKARHRLPMLSLANSYSEEDILDFDSKIRKFLLLKDTDPEVEYFCELKFDGLAIELIYEGGSLTQALTRGDGLIGEDVTANIKTIRTIPLKLKTEKPPRLIEIRGEVLIFKKDFALLNEAQQEQGLQTFANPRNAAAGTIRQLDSKIAASRPLRFFAYALGAYDGITFPTQKELEDQFESYGLPVADNFEKTPLRKICKGRGELINFYKNVEKVREKLEFDIDGIVIKVNSFAKQDELGMIARSPRWATAAKYKPQQAETIVENILVQVGRTGALTPVAIMKPVKVGGVTITNATLHNQEEISRKDVRVGDAVIIQRAGDVIPEIVSVILDKRGSNSTAFKMPTACPECHKPVHQLEGEIVLRCTNPLCPAIVKESLKHFASRRAMNMEKVGDKIIDALNDAGFLNCFSDFYTLTQENILSLDRQGEKSSQNILQSIESSKQTTLPRFIYSMGIRFVGEQTAKSLAQHFVTFDSFLKATQENLLEIPDIGPKVAQSILEWLENKSAVNDAKSLLKLGVKIEEVKRKADGPLSGKTFLITGTLPVKRDAAKDLIEQNGGKILSSVSSKLSYLIVGDDPGSKVEKAQSLGVNIIDWSQFENLLKEIP